MKISDLLRSFKNYALYERGIQPKSYRSICSTLNMLCKFAQSEDIHKIDHYLISDFFYYGRAERGWKSQTFRNHWHSLKTFFRWCVAREYIKVNPAIGIEKPKRDKILPRCLSTEEAKKVMYHTFWHPWRYKLEKHRNEAIIATFMMTGLRLQELLNLEVMDVDLTSRHILVRQGKGRKDRYVPIHPKLSTILGNYLDKRRESNRPSRWFFTGVKSAKPLTQKDVRRICEKVSIASGVKFTPHMLRHTFAREMIDNDFNLYKLKEIMGHADITTTQRYLAISIGGIRKSLDQLKIF